MFSFLVEQTICIGLCYSDIVCVVFSGYVSRLFNSIVFDFNNVLQSHGSTKKIGDSRDLWSGELWGPPPKTSKDMKHRKVYFLHRVD